MTEEKEPQNAEVPEATETDKTEQTPTEDPFFGTGHFSFHTQPDDGGDDPFLGE